MPHALCNTVTRNIHREVNNLCALWNLWTLHPIIVWGPPKRTSEVESITWFFCCYFLLLCMHIWGERMIRNCVLLQKKLKRYCVELNIIIYSLENVNEIVILPHICCTPFKSSIKFWSVAIIMRLSYVRFSQVPKYIIPNYLTRELLIFNTKRYI